MPENLAMWSYYRDKRCSIREAMEGDFPVTLKSDPELVAAVAQIKSAELLIDAKMRELEEKAQEHHE